jgi:multidrug efflux pump subunit AcrA (membrane-fusion protein)
MNRRAVLVVAVTALLLAGCRSEDEAPAGRGAPLREAAPPAAVSVEPVRIETLADSIEAVGTVQSRRHTVLSSKVLAAVVAVHRHEGDRVRAGDVVVELDDRDARAQRARAEAALREAHDAVEEAQAAIEAADRAIDAAAAQQELAAATLARYTTLLERRSVAAQEHDEVAAKAKAAAAEVARARQTKASLLARERQAAARIEQAEAELARARVALTHATITAPANGIVVSKTVEVGTIATPGAALLTVEEQRYRLELSVPESDIRNVRIGQRTVATVDALGLDLQGIVVEIVPAADPTSRTFTVKVDLPGDERLRSGLYGRARFTAGQRTVMLVPRQAVRERGQLQQVFVVDGSNIARLRLVTTGKAADDRVEILSGLGEGERVVVQGAERLTDGSRVEVRG